MATSLRRRLCSWLVPLALGPKLGARALVRVLPAFGVGLGAGLTIVVSTSFGTAKACFTSAYGFERTWTSAIRLVRVDYGFALTEKDETSGYLLFEYRSNESGSKKSAGSIEVVRGRDPSEPVQVLVQLPQMPQYHEQVLVRALQRKLRDECGEPPARRPPAKDAPDAGGG